MRTNRKRSRSRQTAHSFLRSLSIKSSLFLLEAAKRGALPKKGFKRTRADTEQFPPPMPMTAAQPQDTAQDPARRPVEQAYQKYKKLEA